MTAWQPIETAPKDGTIVLAWSKSNVWRGVHTAFWGRDNPLNPQGWLGGHCHTNHIEQPTHWMPLPAPPPISGAGQNEEGQK